MVCAPPNPTLTGSVLRHAQKLTPPLSQQLLLLSVDDSEHHTDSIPVSLTISVGKEIYFPVASYLKAICVLDSSTQPPHGAVLWPGSSPSFSVFAKESYCSCQWLLPRCTQNNSGTVFSLSSFQQHVHHSSSSKAPFPPH